MNQYIFEKIKNIMKNRVDRKWYGNEQNKSEHNYNVEFCISITSFFKISFNVKENGLDTSATKTNIMKS